MPLLDHFHAPLSEERHWDGFHSKWANALVDDLNQNLLPEGYFAEPRLRAGAGVQMGAEGGPALVAAIELINPANKDRPAHRRAFALTCAGYLARGISLILVDVVTSWQGSLHDDLIRLLPGDGACLFPGGPSLYATAYRPVRRDEADQIDTWLTPLAVGQELPVLPLALTADLCLPINLEATYRDACRKLRLP